MSKRGIVVTPPFTIYGNGFSISPVGPPNPVVLRRALLYWDQIDFPDNNIIHIEEDDNFRFLMESGVAKRTMVSFRGSFKMGPWFYYASQVTALLENNRREPDVWSLCQTGEQIYLPPEVSYESRTIEVELYQALPAPPDDIPFAEILEFKRKRNAELLALRAALDDLYLDVTNAADLPRAKTSAIDRLDLILADVRKAASESWGHRLIPKVKVALNIPEVIKTVAVTVVVAKEFGLPLSVAVAAGTFASLIKFDWGSVARVKELSSELRPYAYLISAQKELRV